MNPADVERAIATVERSRGTHVAWLAYIADPPECNPDICRLTPSEHIEIAGDAEHHQRCVDGYDQVLSVLRAINEQGAS